MKLSFIIINYKSEKYLAKCISSIKDKVSDIENEIIVVNNDNSDLEVELPNHLEAEPPRAMKIINVSTNVGFGRACNIGTGAAQGEILCLLNPDTEIISDKIKDLIQELDDCQKIGIIGPKLIDEEGKTQEWIVGKEITALSVLLNNLGYKRDKAVWESRNPVECAWVSGAAMFVRREIFKEIGGFDEKYFMYFEDADLCRRARQAGYKVLYFPDFAIRHFGGKSFLDKKTQKCYYRKSQRRYFGKYFANKIFYLRRKDHA